MNFRPWRFKLDLLYPDCRWSLGPLLNFKANAVAFLEAFKAVAFNGAMVNENVFSTAINRDKPETLLIVKPFYRTLLHS